MDKAKRKRLESAGWRVGSAADFLGLSPAESAILELKLMLVDELKRRRRSERLTQTEVAKRLRSSQSRVAKMEAGDASVSLDLLVRSVLELGASRRDLARLLGQSPKTQREPIRRSSRPTSPRAAA